MEIFYVDALAGMGKTNAVIAYALSESSTGSKVAIIQPSIDLLDQTYAAIQSANINKVNVSKYHSHSIDESVKGSVTNHLATATPDVGEILLTTQQTFFAMKSWYNSSDWDIIFDEIPQVFTEWVKKLDINFATLTDNLVLANTKDNYAEISINPKNEDIINRIADCITGDEQDKLYQEIALRLVNKDTWHTVIHVPSFEKVKSGNSNGVNSIQTYSLMKPESLMKYKSVTVIGSMFTKSIMYLLWKEKVTFKEHTIISNYLLSKTHQNGHLLTVKYLYEINWSKAVKDQILDGYTVYKQAKLMVKKLMMGMKFIYAANVSDEMGIPFGIRIRNTCNGLNEHRGIHNAVFASALNSSGASLGYMKSKNVSASEMEEAQYLATMYRLVTRTSLRDQTDTSHKTVIVMDKRAADFLSSIFTGCTVEHITDMTVPVKKKRGRPADGIVLTNAQRVAKSRAKAKAKKLADALANPLNPT
jgi:hypothetical protein